MTQPQWSTLTATGEPENNIDAEDILAGVATTGDILSAEIFAEKSAGDVVRGGKATAAPAPTNSRDQGVSVVAHIAALQAKHDAELRAVGLAETVKRLEVKKKFAEAQSIAPGISAKSESSQSSTGGGSRADRRRRELEWDKRSYVPVGNYDGNPGT